MKTKHYNIFSAFDGMSCGQIAIAALAKKYGFSYTWYASEIDPYAIKKTQENFPDTVQLGDIQKVRGADLPRIDLLIGGSPCQGFSIAGKQLAFDDPRSALFFEFIRLKNELQPRYFFLENVPMQKEHENVISNFLNVKPLRINSSLLTAQSRKRLYWTNIYARPEGLFGDLVCNIPQPKDKGILLKHILQPSEEVDTKYFLSEKMLSGLKKASRAERFKVREIEKKAAALTARYAKMNCSDNYVEDAYIIQRPRGYNDGGEKHDKAPTLTSGCSWENNNFVVQLNYAENGNPEQCSRVYADFGKCCCVGMRSDKHWVFTEKKIRRLTPIECERLQGVPDNYTAGVSDTQRYRMLGNGWTVSVVQYIFEYIFKK